MRCSDTLLGFAIFFVFGCVAALAPGKLRDVQVFIRSKIPFGNSVPFGWTMQKGWYLTLIRVQGGFFIAFALFLLLWHLRHCVSR
jgi:hypothetical protein